MKKIIILIVSIVVLLATIISLIFILTTPPKYEEIRGRLEELLEESYEVNKVIFGEGLPTYPRVYDPKSSMKVYETGEYYTDSNGNDMQRRVWYYTTHEQAGVVVAFRDSYLEEYSYVLVSESEREAEELKESFPNFEGSVVPEEHELYSMIFRGKDGKYCYLIPYREPDYNFFYRESDPENYDYVDIEQSQWRTVEEIKSAMSKVYSKKFMASMDEPLFVGVAVGEQVSNARFYEDDSGALLQTNQEKPMFTEKRVYLLDTGVIKRWGSNRSYVRIEIDSYLPSEPQKIIRATLTISLQDGKWYFAAPSF